MNRHKHNIRLSDNQHIHLMLFEIMMDLIKIIVKANMANLLLALKH
jgi:hypothetical protein